MQTHFLTLIYFAPILIQYSLNINVNCTRTLCVTGSFDSDVSAMSPASETKALLGLLAEDVVETMLPLVDIW